MIPVLLIASTITAANNPYDIITNREDVRSEAVEDLIKDLGRDPKAGRKAAMRLVRFGSAAVPALKRALNNPKVQVRFYAASTLDLIRHPSAARALLPVLRKEEEEPAIRKIAARAMGRAESAAAVPVLLKMLLGGRKPAKGKPSTAGAGPEPKKPDPSTPQYLVDGPLAIDEDFRFEVIRSLSYIGEPETADVLMDAMRDSSSRIREVAAQGIGDQRVPEAMDGLRKLLDDTENRVAAAAARALSKYASAAKDATPDLISTLKHPDLRVRRNAQGALATISGRSFTTHTRWLEWWKAKRKRDLEARKLADQPRQPPPPPRLDPLTRDNPLRGAKDEDKAKGPPPALRPPWEWDDQDWKKKSED